MCGRFTQAYTWREIAALYDLTQPALNLRPRYNIAPTTTIDVVVPTVPGRYALEQMRWGIVPSWWKKTLAELPSTFNARAETVAEKPMFRAAFRRSRCVVPASGYYEWKATPNGKQPYYISARDGLVLSFAGLWEVWHDPESEEVVKSCTIIVTAANALTRPIHDRMPVVLDVDDVEIWLGGSRAADLLRPAPEDALQMWPVSRRVNRVGNDGDRTLINAIE